MKPKELKLNVSVKVEQKHNPPKKDKKEVK